MDRFEEYCARNAAKHGEKFRAPKIEKFIYAYNLGDKYRVKVRTTYPSGEVFERWGFVTLTTGWIPSFMLMRVRGQHGSSDLLDEKDEIVATRWIK